MPLETACSFHTYKRHLSLLSVYLCANMSNYKPLTHRIAASLLLSLYAGLYFATWASRIPAIKDQFNLNEAELGAVLFMLPLGALVALALCRMGRIGVGQQDHELWSGCCLCIGIIVHWSERYHLPLVYRFVLIWFLWQCAQYCHEYTGPVGATGNVQ